MFVSVVLVALPSRADEAGTKSFTYKKTKQGDLEMIVHYPPGWKETDRRPAIVFSSVAAGPMAASSSSNPRPHISPAVAWLRPGPTTE
jgi:hypothetical protein